MVCQGLVCLFKMRFRSMDWRVLCGKDKAVLNGNFVYY